MAALPKAENITPRQISYDDVSDLAQKFDSAAVVIHLAGILMESKHSKYGKANVEATRAVVAAAKQAKVQRLIFISVIGADANSSNRYFQSKGQAEQLILDSGLSAAVIRTPILLGPQTAGASAIVGMAGQPKVKLLGGGHYVMRPLDVDDLCNAILNACVQSETNSGIHELVGPTPTAYCDLIAKTANLLGHSPAIATVPIWSAKLISGVVSSIKGGGISPTVIDVITMNETVAQNADEALAIKLTSLDETLAKIVA